MTAKLGDQVLTPVDPRQNNGGSVAVGLVTNVKDVDGDERVNLRVFLDTGADIRKTDVEMVKSEPKAEDDSVSDASGVKRVAWKA